MVDNDHRWPLNQFLLISHDLSVIRHMCDRVAVMYLGKIVEEAEAETLFTTPLHPYTKALVSSIPSLNPEKRHERIILKGDVPSPANPPSGCHFHPRCPIAESRCYNLYPDFREISMGCYTACHLIRSSRKEKGAYSVWDSNPKSRARAYSFIKETEANGENVALIKYLKKHFLRKGDQQ